MRLATFNLESFGSDRFDPETLAPRLTALRPRLCELEADIVCLQEVNAQKVSGASIRQFLALDRLITGTPYEHYHRATSERAPGKGPNSRHNLVILSRYPILAQDSLFQQHARPPLWQPVTADPAYDSPQEITFERPILRTRLDAGRGGPLHLFAVHLRALRAAPVRGGKTSARTWKSTAAWAEGYQLSMLKQISQALELRLAVDAVFDQDESARIIVTGDFNASGEAVTLRLLRADPADTRTPGLEHRRLYQLDASLPLEQRQTVLHRGKGRALDHILASPAMTGRTISVRVFNAGLDAEASKQDPGSDHAAMCAEFDL